MAPHGTDLGEEDRDITVFYRPELDTPDAFNLAVEVDDGEELIVPVVMFHERILEIMAGATEAQLGRFRLVKTDQGIHVHYQTPNNGMISLHLPFSPSELERATQKWIPGTHGHALFMLNQVLFTFPEE